MNEKMELFTHAVAALPYLDNLQSAYARNAGDRKIEMTLNELKFLGTMLTNFTPANKVLEIGVAAGGTSAFILKMLNLLGSPATLYSCDINTKYYGNKQLDTGYMVKAHMPELCDKFALFAGGLITRFLPSIGGDIDFVILDTMHRVPGELLDYLCILPYLKNDCLLVLHDTALHILRGGESYATRLLYAVSVGQKYDFQDLENPYGIGNISAVQITPDSSKYVGNVFQALMLPWSYMPSDDQLQQYEDFYFKHYSPALCGIFTCAVQMNKRKLAGRAR